MGMGTRAARLDDIDWLVAQLREFSKFFATKRSLFGDEAYVREGLKTLISDHLVLFACDDEDTPIGFIAGMAHPHLFNPTIRVLTESFWWVEPSRRGGKAALVLLEEFIFWGKANCDWVVFTLEHHSPVKESQLTKRGFSLQERNYLLEVGV